MDSAGSQTMDVNPFSVNKYLLSENCQRTQNEQFYYQAWKTSEREKQQLLQEVSLLRQEVQSLKTQFSSSSITNAANILNNENSGSIATDKVQYCTDEEDLAQETDWIRKKTRKNKKRKMNTSLSPPKPDADDIQQPNRKSPLPPPVIVEGLKDFNKFHDQLDKLVSGYKIKIMNNGSWKINVSNEDHYRHLTKMLNEKNISWFSFENKQNRPIRVIVNKLHHSCEPNKIISDLRNKGFKIIEAVNKLKWNTKQPLNMFMLTFKTDEDINKIFSITNIMGMRVDVQPIRKSKLIPQCKRCQSYGHTQSYCFKEPRCVKCTGKHFTKDCQKPSDTKPKCIHCGEDHPANYRGCTVAKELQKIKNKQGKNPTLPKQPTRENQENTNPSIQSNPPRISKRTKEDGRLYNQVVSNSSKPDNASNAETTEQTLQLILEKLNNQSVLLQKFEERLIHLEYSAKGAIPKKKNGEQSYNYGVECQWTPQSPT